MNVSEAIRGRVSVKEYGPGPVARERIEELLELASLVPNHRMTEPLHFRVLGENAKRAYGEALAGRKTRKMDDAEAAAMVREKVVRRHMRVPAIIAVLMDQDEDPEIREEDYATAFMAIQNLSLAAVELGLGTHVKTGAVMDEPALREALRAGEDQRVVSLVFLGTPAELPDAKDRTPAADRTIWLD